MFSVKLTGGLGNQMFIYAFAKAFEQKGFPIYLSTYEYKTIPLFTHANNAPPPAQFLFQDLPMESEMPKFSFLI